MFFLKTRSSKHYNDDFNIKEKVRDKNEVEGGFVICDGMLDYNHKAIDPFFTIGL